MNQKPYENLKCPNCNSSMISRKGPYGVFWGCDNYPECKGTRDSQGRSKEERNKEKDKEYDETTNTEETKDTFNRNYSAFKRIKSNE